MKIWTEPKVSLVATTNTVEHFPFDWLSGEEYPLQDIIEFSGRLCYLSFGKSVDADGHKTLSGRTDQSKYIENIIRSHHGSVLEHANVTFLFEGVSRSLTHELVRHRHLSYSQLSQRYVDESNVGFVLPPEIKQDTEEYEMWYKSCQHTLGYYVDILARLQYNIEDSNATSKKKRARQTARSVLPNCTETKIVVTGNLRAWRHFIHLRGSMYADTEIRKIAMHVAAILHELAPDVFFDIQGSPFEVTLEEGSI